MKGAGILPRLTVPLVCAGSAALRPRRKEKKRRHRPAAHQNFYGADYEGGVLTDGMAPIAHRSFLFLVTCSPLALTLVKRVRRGRAGEGA